jgi:hypothetical protein
MFNPSQTCMLTTNDCIHGGYMDLAKCECVACEKMWSGARCDVCTRQVSLCLNDFEGWDDAQCACKCSAQFKGTFCEKKVCDKKPDCGHGGQWDPYQCKCLACDGLWGGEECNTCTISPTVCESKGGTLDAATCKCKDCANYWMGPTCGGEWRRMRGRALMPPTCCTYNVLGPHTHLFMRLLYN